MNTRLETSNKLQYRLFGTGVVIAILSALAMFVELETESVPMLSGYDFRRPVSVNISQVEGSQDLFKYTSLLVLDDSWVREVSYGGEVKDLRAWDIALTKKDGITSVPFELESYDPQAGKLAIWVHLDTLHSSDPDQLYLYYGGNASSDPSDLSFWYQDYLGVWHLDSSYEDSGPGSWNLANSGVSPTISQIGYGISNNNSSYLSAGNISTIGGADSITGSIWVKLDDLNSDGALFAKGNWGPSLPILFWRDEKGNNSGRTNTFSILVYGDNVSKRIEGEADIANDTGWHYVTFTFAAGEADGLRLYVDGVEDPNSPVDVSAISSLLSNSELFRIGRSSSSSSLEGTLDEARLSAKVRSGDWIKTEYNNQSDPGSFWTVGPEEVISEGLPVGWVSQEAKWLGGRDIELTWITSNELNNEQFLIERSLEGSRFEVIEEVKSRGDSGAEQSYVYHDLKPNHFSGSRITYRIRQVDFDGQSSVSPMVEAHIEESQAYSLELYPNPFTDVLRIEMPESSKDGYKLALRDINGSLIQEEEISGATAGEVVTWYPPGNIPAGPYLVEIRSGSNRRYSERIIHQ